MLELCLFVLKLILVETTVSEFICNISPNITLGWGLTSRVVVAGHVSFIKEVAVTEPPTHLQHLLKVLQTRGYI